MIWLFDLFDSIGRFLAGIMAGLITIVCFLGAVFIVDWIATMRREAGRPLAGKWLWLIGIVAAFILYSIMQPISHALRGAACKNADNYEECVDRFDEPNE